MKKKITRREVLYLSAGLLAGSPTKGLERSRTPVRQRCALEAEVGRIGAEQEPFLVDRMLNPAPVGPEVLAGISDPRVTSELGRFNLEANLSPRTLTGHCLRERENEALELVELVRQTAASFEAECCWEGFFPPHAKAISR
jgi:hypothetical protein